MSRQYYLSELRQLPGDLPASFAAEILNDSQVEHFLVSSPAHLPERGCRPFNQKQIRIIPFFQKWNDSVYTFKQFRSHKEGHVL